MFYTILGTNKKPDARTYIYKKTCNLYKGIIIQKLIYETQITPDWIGMFRGIKRRLNFVWFILERRRPSMNIEIRAFY